MSIKTYEDAEQQLRDYLTENGLRCTIERLAILRAIWEHGGHPSADIIADQLSAGKLYVSRATVYRTLDLLVDSELLCSVKLGEGHRHYEVNISQHDHIICQTTERVIEIRDEELERKIRSLCESRGFCYLSHVLEIKADCEPADNGGKEDSNSD
ncbi:transcriptional repressor [bacterium]|nr:transcriptional repressor [bacterium]